MASLPKLTRIRRHPRGILYGIVIAALCLAVLWFASISWRGTAFILVGILAYYLVIAIAGAIATYNRFFEKVPVLSTAMLLMVFVFLGIAFYNYLQRQSAVGGGDKLPIVEYYHATIQPLDLSENEFEVRETVELDEFPGRTFVTVERIRAQPLGLLLREVKFSPLGTDKGIATLDVSSVAHKLQDENLFFRAIVGLPSTLNVMWASSPQVNVELRDMPKGSYYAAKYSTPNAQAYVSTENVFWRFDNPNYDVRFAYLPPPLHYLRPILNPFVETYSFANWIIPFAGGLLGPLIWTMLKRRHKALLRIDNRVKHSAISVLLAIFGRDNSAVIKELTLDIFPKNQDLEVFQAKRVVLLATTPQNRLRISLPALQVEVDAKDSNMRELKIPLFPKQTVEAVEEKLPAGISLLREFRDATIKIELTGMPSGSFVSAKHANATKYDYLGTETISWEVSGDKSVTQFCFIHSNANQSQLVAMIKGYLRRPIRRLVNIVS